jgi:predicted DNA-binding transcriptional regulator AlpA
MASDVLYPNKRLFNMKEFMNYTGLGESKARQWAKKIGCMRKIGRRTVFDRMIIDNHINGLEAPKDE